MELLLSDEIKIKMLKKLQDEKERTINSLREEIGAVNYNSVKKNCLFLEKIGFIKTDVKSVKNEKSKL